MNTILFVILFRLTGFAACPGSPPTGIDCVVNSQTKDIAAHASCKRVTNNHASGLDLMVPYKTFPEWLSFYSSPPSGVLVNDCPLASPVRVAGGTTADVTNFGSVTYGGTADSGRLMVFLTSYRDTGGDRISAVSLGGVSFTKAVEAAYPSNFTEIWYGVVPTGSSGTLTVTGTGGNGSINDCRWSVYRIDNPLSTTPVGVGQNSGTGTSISIANVATTAGGVALAAGVIRILSGGYSFSAAAGNGSTGNLNFDDHTYFGANNYNRAGHFSKTTPATSSTEDFTFSASTSMNSIMACIATWR